MIFYFLSCYFSSFLLFYLIVLQKSFKKVFLRIELYIIKEYTTKIKIMKIMTKKTPIIESKLMIGLLHFMQEFVPKREYPQSQTLHKGPVKPASHLLSYPPLFFIYIYFFLIKKVNTNNYLGSFDKNKYCLISKIFSKTLNFHKKNNIYFKIHK